MTSIMIDPWEDSWPFCSFAVVAISTWFATFVASFEIHCNIVLETCRYRLRFRHILSLFAHSFPMSLRTSDACTPWWAHLSAALSRWHIAWPSGSPRTPEPKRECIHRDHVISEIYVFAGRSSFFINYLHCWPALLQHIWLLRLIKHLEPFLLHASGFVSPCSTLPIFLRFRMCMWNENSERIIFSTLHTLTLVICIWSGAQEFYHSHEITIENMSPLFLSSRFPLSPFCWQLNAWTL